MSPSPSHDQLSTHPDPTREEVYPPTTHDAGPPASAAWTAPSDEYPKLIHADCDWRIAEVSSGRIVIEWKNGRAVFGEARWLLATAQQRAWAREKYLRWCARWGTPPHTLLARPERRAA